VAILGESITKRAILVKERVLTAASETIKGGEPVCPTFASKREIKRDAE